MMTAMRYLSNPEDAEDAVQETFLRMWTNRARLPEMLTPEAFTMQTLVNICIDRLRSQKSRLHHEAVSLQEEALELRERETPYSLLELHNAVELVGRIIDGLPFTQRTVIRMRDVEGFDLQEIARIMDIELSAVRVYLSRARMQVKKEFINANKYITI